MTDNKERDQRVTREIAYWRVKANENWQRKCAAYEAEIERYKPFMGYSNTPVKGMVSRASSLFRSKYGFMALTVLLFEIWFFIDIPVSFLSRFVNFDVIFQHMKHIIPIFGEHIFTTGGRSLPPSHQVSYSDEVGYKIYLLACYFLFTPLKVFLLFKWLDSERLNKVYRIYVISPLTVVKGLSAKEDISEPMRLEKGNYKNSPPIYRSMLSRVIWSFIIIMLSMLFSLPVLMGNKMCSPHIIAFACLFFSISCCILKDYFIYFKLLISSRKDSLFS